MANNALPFSFAVAGEALTEPAIAELRSQLSPLNSAAVMDVLDGPSPAFTDYFAHYGFVELSAAKPHAQYRIGTLALSNGLQLVAHSWSQVDARATVCLFHGLFDHTGLYLTLVEHLLSEGLNVIALDMPGHGLSEGARAAIQSFTDYAAVVESAVNHAKHVAPALPVMALGQSTGAAAVMNYQLAFGERSALAKAVYLAPLIRPHKWALIRGAIALLGPMLATFPRGFSVNSHNQYFCDFLKLHDPLQSRSLSIPWLKAMAGWVGVIAQRFEKGEAAPELADTPLLIVQGTGDKTVDWQKNIEYLQELAPSAQIVLVDQAKHHLVNELDSFRTPMFESVAHFFRSI